MRAHSWVEVQAVNDRARFVAKGTQTGACRWRYRPPGAAELCVRSQSSTRRSCSTPWQRPSRARPALPTSSGCGLGVSAVSAPAGLSRGLRQVVLRAQSTWLTEADNVDVSRAADGSVLVRAVASAGGRSPVQQRRVARTVSAAAVCLPGVVCGPRQVRAAVGPGGRAGGRAAAAPDSITRACAGTPSGRAFPKVGEGAHLRFLARRASPARRQIPLTRPRFCPR
jgi:hypothetical protein